MTQQDIDNGGPAFPQEHRAGNVSKCVGGMTIRDYFAGQALVGLCSNRWIMKSMEKSVSPRLATAVAAYEYADAMLEARNR